MMNNKNYFLLIFYIFYEILIISGSENSFSLNGNSWIVRNEDNNVSTTGIVPGGIYTDLMNAGIIDDIYYEDNDVKYRWVSQESWIYNYIFDVNENILNYQQINLVFEGLDTISTIFLNGNQIGKTDNMFIKYVYDIKNYLKVSNNNLTVKFNSPIKESKKLFDKQAENYIIYPKCVPQTYNGECHVNFLRKMQASFAWDWGPAFPSVGIWKPVYIEYFNDAIIRDVTIQTTTKNYNWIINATVYLSSKLKTISGILEAKLKTNTEETFIYYYMNDKKNYQEEVVANMYLSVPQLAVDLWWPNGYGEPKLYEFTITYISSKQERHNKTINVGFRTIELIQNKLKEGLTFYFKVNNIIIFAKGSNWIPANILPEKGYNQTYVKYLLNSAKKVNMNMLRVWGGGVYESDYFYETADKLGILIWQDFMFACALYPVNNEFINSVNVEIKQQVRRLQHHPSIAVWGGNNENELAIVTGWWPTGNNEIYKKDYRTLYVNNIRETCLKNDITRSFVVSSPSNGLQSDKENYFAKNPGDEHYGDVHVYKYLVDGWDHTTYPKPRFASEYGFQSLPAYETLGSKMKNYTRDFLNHRQHHIGGYEEMKILINKHLDLEDTDDLKGLKKFIYYSQISQAMAIKAETENYRQWASSLDSIGSGLTKGALYWQLNDVWQAPSWSSIDSDGRWKMLHYFAKKFFNPVLVSSSLSVSRYLSIYVTSDVIKTIPNVTLLYTVYKYNDFTPLRQESKIVTILPGYSVEMAGFYIDDFLSESGCGTIRHAKDQCFMILELKTQYDLIGYENFIFPGKLKDAIGIKQPIFTVKVKKYDIHKYYVSIQTSAIAPFVWLKTRFDGEFSDNGFLQYTQMKIIEYYNERDIPENLLESSISISSVFSNNF